MMPFEKNNLSSQELIDHLALIPAIGTAFRSKVRHYTIETHTFLVLSEFEKYFSSFHLPISTNLFRMILALHDIGKPLAHNNTKLNQYVATIEIISNHKEYLFECEADFSICKALLSSDVLGEYMQKKIDATNTKQKIITLAKDSNLSLVSFWKLLLIYYQCDIASYTADAGGYTYLEHLFAYQNGIKQIDIKQQRLIFSSTQEAIFVILEKILLS